jgi:hypothetical protein
MQSSPLAGDENISLACAKGEGTCAGSLDCQADAALVLFVYFFNCR